MIRSDSFNKILELKRNKVIEVVHRICSKRNLPIPTINFEGCEGEHEGQLAHYHPDINTICISERQLNIQNFDDLERTMAHEVSHILVQDHSPRFLEQESISNIAGWKPPAGVVHITGGSSTKKTTKKGSKTKPDKVNCNYHLCRKKAKLTQCSHCKGYFCDEHIEPYEPRIGNQPGHSRDESGHPCFAYVDYLAKKKEEDDKRYSDALNKLVGKRKKEPQVIIHESQNSKYEKKTKEADEPYLYRYILPKGEEDKKPPEVQEHHKKEYVGRYEEDAEMYVPKSKEHSNISFSRIHGSFRNFLRRYIYFRIQDDVKPHLKQFSIIFIIGLVLNYVYYQTLSLHYLFIGGVKQWFSVLMPILNYGLGSGYNLFYLVINGIFYAYFYYSLIQILYNIITNLDDRDTWVMLGWFVLIIWEVIKLFPQII